MRFENSQFILFVFLLPILISCSGKKHQSNWEYDVNGDGKKESFVYTIVDSGKEYITSSLSIKTENNQIYWFHEWQMHRSDLYDDIFTTSGELTERGELTLEEWLSGFFECKLDYTSCIYKAKLKREDIVYDFVKYSAKKEKLTTKQLMALIINNKEHVIFHYRATWREDLLELVFVPTLNKFIHFGMGNY